MKDYKTSVTIAYYSEMGINSREIVKIREKTAVGEWLKCRRDDTI